MTRTRRQKRLKTERTKECVTGKARFPDKLMAELFIATSQREQRKVGKGSLTRAYLCPHCHAWHVTSH